MRRIVEAAGGILYRWKDDAEPTRASSPSVKSNIATDGTIIANTTDSDGETTAAPGASDAASTPDPAQADSPATADNVLNRIELCIVHRPKYDDWSWPKGKVDPNESHRHAAVREIGVAIQNWICLVSADRSLVWRCLLPSSDSGYSMSPR